ncbi:DUF4082 domain-containing protein [Methylobacterium indicum]|uniref:DUF4082 domain-containing protein n=1 Tax=Methylobacterium indicum TaxID=1775910 RepID=UPI000A53B5D8|nr:DUF4082 domain-containing protein [Methylobacterium indicum]
MPPATFSNPVTLTPGATYTAFHHTNTSRYSQTANGFANAVTSGPLTAPSNEKRGLRIKLEPSSKVLLGEVRLIAVSIAHCMILI